MSHLFLFMLTGLVIEVFTGHALGHTISPFKIIFLALLAIFIDGARFLSWLHKHNEI